MTTPKKLRLALGQINLLVGDIAGNARRIVAAAERACEELSTDLLVLPELTLSGYPPEDLLFHRGFRKRIDASLAGLAESAQGIDLLVGYPEYSGGVLFNSAAWFRDGRLIANYRKQRLPNYQVFDEKRYFTPGEGFTAVEIGGNRVVPIICEDVWHPDITTGARRASGRSALLPKPSCGAPSPLPSSC